MIMHYDGHDVPAGAMNEMFKLVSHELKARKPFAALRDMLRNENKPVEQAQDCAQPCPEVELGLT
jgi:hypothetical protein